MPRLSDDMLAQRLREAYHVGTIAPMRDGIDPLDEVRAYAVQLINTQFWQAGGRQITGKKVGLAAVEAQQRMGVDHPNFGILFDDMAVQDGGKLDFARMLQPRVEGEVAFVLNKALIDVNTSREAAANAVGAVHAAIEIVDTRIADWQMTYADMVADNGAASFYVLSARGIRLDDLDLSDVTMTMKINQTYAASGSGATVMGDPLNALAWLAGFCARQGQPLRAGDVVLSGSLGPMVPLQRGDHVRVVVGDVGSVSFTCSEAT